jgi:hypothetical protein
VTATVGRPDLLAIIRFALGIIWLLWPLGKPAMFFNPFLSFRLRTKVAEVAFGMLWPRKFDAPTT